MNKELQKLIDDSKNKSYSKLTDKQLAQFQNFVIEGGIKRGNAHYKNKTGLFGMSDIKQKIAQINGGIVAGNLAVKNGTVSKAAKISIKSPKHVNNRKLICPHCNKEGGYVAMKRHHMDRCKHKNGGE